MALANVIGGFGLAGAAGLNAYIPLLIVAILGRAGVIQLTAPYDALTSWWAIGALVILLVIEVVVDKVPGADHVNDAIQTFVRPAAGAILFAANAGIVREASPILALVTGLVLALGVHTTKAVARPVINASTIGLGAPVISVVEDVTSAITSLMAIYAPILLVICVVIVAILLYRLWRSIRLKRAASSMRASS